MFYTLIKHRFLTNQSARRVLCYKGCFTITAEILARSLANFYSQYADKHNFEIHATRQRARAGNSTISSVLPTSQVVYQPINHKNLWSTGP